MTVMNYTSLETSLTAVSRIKTFEENTPSEELRADGRTFEEPPDGWPHSGRVIFASVSLNYDTPNNTALVDEKTATTWYALNDISLSIPTGQNIAIVGRSGSGKSTLLSALARMTDVAAGSILVDGFDTSRFLPSVVRSRAFNIIPQEPFFFHRTVARNLDPFGTHSDEEMLTALEKVHLLDVVIQMGGLRAEIGKLDLQLSQGQKQLLALARALLAKSEAKIVLVDEATSSVDQHTARMMQEVILHEFGGPDKTIFAVAHQLRTVMEFDTIVVMEAGRIIERGRPSDLLEDPETAFRRMWDSQS